jgi:hypothetical protein
LVDICPRFRIDIGQCGESDGSRNSNAETIMLVDTIKEVCLDFVARKMMRFMLTASKMDDVTVWNSELNISQ